MYEVITDHVGQEMQESGAVERRLAGGAHVLVYPDGDAAWIVCGELVPVWTEDGVVDGRCRRRVDPADAVPLACPGHAEAIRSWRGMSEWDKAAWERAQDVDA